MKIFRSFLVVLAGLGVCILINMVSLFTRHNGDGGAWFFPFPVQSVPGSAVCLDLPSGQLTSCGGPTIIWLGVALSIVYWIGVLIYAYKVYKRPIIKV